MAFFVSCGFPVHFMIDVGNSTDRSLLFKAIKSSRDAIDLFDDNRTEMLRDYAGPLYSPYGPRDRRYVNKINLTARNYQMFLAANNPQCIVNTPDPKMWPFARKFQVNVNRVAANINLQQTMQECVLDAFFLIGIANVRMADAGMKEVEPNVWLDPGKPWVDRISLSDVVLDMPARSLRAMRFYGHKYRAVYQAVRSRDDYDYSVTKQLTPTKKINDNAKSIRGDTLTTQNALDDDELEEMCWLMDVFLPREQLLVTFSADNDTLAPLKVVDWDGSERGPYKFLCLGYMPDNPMPTTPAQQLILLDRMQNRLYGKLSDQADREKQNFAFSGGQEDIALRWKNSVDGEVWNAGQITDLKNSLVPMSTPGPDANVHSFFLAAQEVYNTQAGNERALAGLGEEASTATQEQQIAAHAGGLIGYLKTHVNDFASEVMREIGNLMWDDKHLEVETTMDAENTGRYIDSSWKPKDRKGKKDQYDFTVEHNSMEFRPPEAKLKTLSQFVQAYLQLLPAIQAGVLDGEEFARIYSEYTNTPEILKIVRQMPQQQTEGGGDPHEATKAPSTSREVVRRSVGGGPKGQGMQAVLVQAMQSNQRQAARVGSGA